MVAGEKAGARAVHVLGGLRVAEKVVLAFLAYTVVASLLFPLSFRQRALILALNLAATAVIVLVSRIHDTRRWVSTSRDWFPAVLILVAYRESGLFFKPDPTHHLDYLFIQWDRMLLQNRWVESLLSFSAPWLQYYLELSYLLCYPLVPLGLAALYLARPSVAAVHASPVLGGTSSIGVSEEFFPRTRSGSSPIDRFWTVVLLATLFCYAIYPLFPLVPPRVLFHDVPGPAVEPLLRKWNFWILNQYSVQACIFPSGHVAAVTAVALAVRAYMPRVGVLFIIAAVSIAVATVYGRYHYAADAVAGALVGFAAFWVSTRIRKW